MKKTLLFLFLSMIAVVLTACGSEEARTFEMEESGVKSTLTYTYSGDEVISQKSESVVNYEELGMEKADVEEFMKPLAEQYEGIDGLEYNIEYGEEEAVEIIDFNYDELDFEKAIKVDGFYLQGDAEQGVSMEKSAELIQEQGYTEVEE